MKYTVNKQTAATKPGVFFRYGFGITVTIYSLSIICIPGVTPAAEISRARSSEWSFSGTAQFGAAAKRSNSRLDPDAQPAAAADHNREADYEFSGLPYLLFDLQLRSPNGVTGYATTPMDEYGLAVGVLIPGTWGDIDLQGYYADEPVWSDPYLVGIDRTETDRVRYGGSLGLNNAFGSTFNVRYTIRQIKIDDDAIARTEPDLARDGIEHRIECSRLIKTQFGDIKPELRYATVDLDGEASSYDSAATRIGWTIPWKRCQLAVSAEAAYRHYQASHPLFEKRRQDIQLQAGALLLYLNPFNMNNVHTGVLAAWQGTESNCDFYDSGTWLGGALVGYSF